MDKTLNIIGLACGVLGALLLALDSWRIGSYFGSDSIQMPSGAGCLWLWVWRAGVTLILSAFALQLIAILIQ